MIEYTILLYKKNNIMRGHKGFVIGGKNNENKKETQ